MPAAPEEARRPDGEVEHVMAQTSGITESVNAGQ